MRPLALALWGVAAGAVLYVAARSAQRGGVEAGFEAISEDVAAVTTQIEKLLERFEGYSSTPYQDEAGLWTIGYGHLIVKGDPYWPQGPQREISRDEAAALLERDMADARRAVDAYVRVPVTENQHAALVSLAFNIGAANFGGSTLVRKLNAGDIDGAAAQFLVWNKVRRGGELVASAGLSSRRASERDLFLSA